MRHHTSGITHDNQGRLPNSDVGTYTADGGYDYSTAGLSTPWVDPDIVGMMHQTTSLVH